MKKIKFMKKEQKQKLKEKTEQIIYDIENDLKFYKKELEYIEGRYGEYRTDYAETQVLAHLERYYEKLKELLDIIKKLKTNKKRRKRWTGRLDINGRKIYDGDWVIYNDYDDKPGKIVYCKSEARFLVRFYEEYFDSYEYLNIYVDTKLEKVDKKERKHYK
jgi:DNA repair exonuclease SbcCD ATPase subunit